MKTRNTITSLLALGLALGTLTTGPAFGGVVVADNDAYIRLDGPGVDNNSGLSVADWNGSPTSLTRYTLVSFDLSAFTSNPNVTGFSSAVLDLGIPTTINVNGDPGTHEVRRLLEDFDQTQVDWAEYTNGNSWQTPGALGATDSISFATGVSPGAASTAWAGGGLDVTAAANAWLTAGDTVQLGFLILPETLTDLHVYGSTEGGGTPNPTLTFTLNVIPEPATTAMLGVATIILSALRRRRRVGE